MVYEHFTSYFGSIRFFKVIEFSTDQLIIQKRKLDFSITKNHVNIYVFEATVFKRGCYIVSSPSTGLRNILVLKKRQDIRSKQLKLK